MARKQQKLKTLAAEPFSVEDRNQPLWQPKQPS